MMVDVSTSADTADLRRGGYDPAWFEKLVQVEDRHFWFRARNQILAATIRRLLPEKHFKLRILEVGCGTGNVLQLLRTLCPDAALVGLDFCEEGLQYAKSRCHCTLLCGDIRRTFFPEQSFDLIGMFDVLEHLAEDRFVLQRLHSLLAPGGFLMLTVPACPALWSYFDEAGGHCRRYDASELREKLQQAGFEICLLTHFMFTVFPVIWAARRMNKFFATKNSLSATTCATNELKVRPLLNEILLGALAWESWWIGRGGKLPKGTSLLAVGKKRAR